MGQFWHLDTIKHDKTAQKQKDITTTPGSSGKGRKEHIGTFTDIERMIGPRGGGYGVPFRLACTPCVPPSPPTQHTPKSPECLQMFAGLQANPHHNTL